MSYTKVRSIKVNVNKNEVTIVSAESNLRTWDDKLIYDDYTYKCESKEDLREVVLSMANNILNGDYQIARSNVISKRISYLIDKGQVEKVGVYTRKIIDNEENKMILSGEKRVNIGEWEIVNRSKTLGFKENKMSVRLVDVRKPYTTYYSEVEANAAYEVTERKGWNSRYDLIVVKVK